MLGAAFAASAALAATADAKAVRAPNRRRWDRTLAALRRAEASDGGLSRPSCAAGRSCLSCGPRPLAAHYDFSADPQAQAAVAAALAVHEPLEEHLNDLVEAMTAAIMRLLQIPAPDLPALAIKIALAVHAVVENDGGDRCLALLKADARRFAALQII